MRALQHANERNVTLRQCAREISFLMALAKPHSVIPGRADRREPGIQKHRDRLLFWIPGSR